MILLNVNYFYTDVIIKFIVIVIDSRLFINNNRKRWIISFSFKII